MSKDIDAKIEKGLDFFNSKMIIERNNYLESKVMELLNALHNPSENPENNVSADAGIIGDILSYAAFILDTNGFDSCHPFYTCDEGDEENEFYDEDNDGIPCVCGECETTDCPMNHRLI